MLSQGKNLSTQARWFLTSAAIILSFIVFIWQNRNRLEAIEHAQNVTRIEDLLHLKEPGYFGGEEPIVQKLYSRHPKWSAKLGITHYNIAVFAMAIVVIAALWR